MRRFICNRLGTLLRPVSLRASTLLLLLPLSACSFITEQPAAEAPPAESGLAESGDNNLPVVEKLISEAGSSHEPPETTKLTPLMLETIDPIATEPTPVEPTVPMSANRIVVNAINDYIQNRQAQLRMWIERSHTYFPMIEQIFEEEDVPDELKYIALGESGLDPTARSWVGATGMWQFMAATASSSGLTINDFVDERRDPEKSTRAAARHLKELFSVYGENWHLALAGYNCSYRCITRAVKLAGGTLEDPPSFWEIYPYLPAETRGFIPKFIVASLLVSNPELYGISADTFGDVMTYDVVEINGTMTLATAARLAGSSVTVLRTLNPELLRDVVPDTGTPYSLKIPVGHHKRFVTAFNRLPPAERTVPDEYVVRSGDTLGRIANQFNVTVSELQLTNRINSHLIHPGQTLAIPGVGSGEPVTLANIEARTVNYGDATFRPIKLSEEFRLVELDNSTDERPLMALALNEELLEDEPLLLPTVYQVRQGDTLSQIAQRHRVSVRDLQEWNNIRGHLIRVGQELTIRSVSRQQPAITTYEVRQGDSLAGIARRFGVSVKRLKQRNGLTGDLIYPGQSLQIN